MIARVRSTWRQMAVVALSSAVVGAGCWATVAATGTPTSAAASAMTTSAMTTSATATSTATATATSSTSAPATPTTPPVPAQYQALSDALAFEVQSLAAAPALSTGTGRKKAKTTIGTELLTANGNIGTGLLQAGAIDRVDAELAAFAALGVTGVTVDVAFPLLLAGTPDHAGYLTFYEKVARAVKDRHMVLSVEENPVFSGTPLTSLHIDYGGLTLRSLAAEQRTEAQSIIDHLRPMYLSVLTEPDTHTKAVGVDVDTPSNAVRFVNGVLEGLHRHGTRVGAGTGNWSSPAIDRALVAKTSIDYLDVHAYVFGPSALSTLAQDVSTARTAHRQLVMDETWLDKPMPGQGSGLEAAPQELHVKSYSFWQPVDEQFVTAMVRYARDNGFGYASFFDGARAFFAYLPWSQSLEAATYAQFSLQYNRAVAAAMAAGVTSGTGRALTQAVRDTPVR